MSKREISWLLAQEARGAAQALRQGIETQIRDSLPPTQPGDDSESGALSTPLLNSFTAFDEAMNLLGNLQSAKGSTRRGRVDVAALLYELSPNATINLNTSEGTEVFGEEQSLKRMLQILLADAGGQAALQSAGPIIYVSRENENVRITANLGPDASHQTALEHRFLNRTALRVGGRVEMTGHSLSLILPADGAAAQKELASLREELEQAQELGEAYARELAGVLVAAEQQVESGRDEREDSVFEGAQRLATSWRFHLALSAQSTGNQQEQARELDTVLALSATAEANRQQNVSWSDVETTVRDSAVGRLVEFQGSGSSTPATLSGAAPQLVLWMVHEALTLCAEEAQGGARTSLTLHVEEQVDAIRIFTKFHESQSSIQAWKQVASDSQGSRSCGAAWALLSCFVQDTEHQAGTNTLSTGQRELWLRLQK